MTGRIIGARILMDRELWERFKKTIKERGYMHASDYIREHIRKVVAGAEKDATVG